MYTLYDKGERRLRQARRNSTLVTARHLFQALLVITSSVFFSTAGTQAEPASEPAVQTPVKEASDGREVLDPEQYAGQVKAGYAAARQIPEIVEKLFCYCGCDLTDCHGSLLDCFTSDHGVDCHICQEEAIIALRLHQKGKSLAYIQKKIDKKYEKEYPFEIESNTLKKYKAERLWGSKKKSESGKPAIRKHRDKKAGCCGSNSDKDPAAEPVKEPTDNP
ncbi:MAG: CYCXC family (seleno)protein [Candidatus Obscuribacterales bacterium]